MGVHVVPICGHNKGGPSAFVHKFCHSLSDLAPYRWAQCPRFLLGSTSTAAVSTLSHSVVVMYTTPVDSISAQSVELILLYQALTWCRLSMHGRTRACDLYRGQRDAFHISPLNADGGIAVPESVFNAIETLLPPGLGRFLELWAAPGQQRSGWTHICERRSD